MSLLDTHTFIWFVFDAPQLSTAAKNRIETEDDVSLSLASVWEMAIKVGTGKLVFPAPVEDFVAEQIARNNIQLLPIKMAHLALVSRLPFHHRGPFDRLIIAQSITENMAVVSADKAFDAYGITRLW